MNRNETLIPDFVRLKKQRNFFAIAAVVLLVGSLGCSLPHFLQKYHEHKRLNEELIALQQTIVAYQDATRKTQAAIIKAQGEITLLTKH